MLGGRVDLSEGSVDLREGPASALRFRGWPGVGVRVRGGENRERKVGNYIVNGVLGRGVRRRSGPEVDGTGVSRS